MNLCPITVKRATAWVAEHHRHLRRELAGAMFGVAVSVAGEIVGVALVTKGPRVWEGTGRCNIARVATNGYPNACSMLYGAICRAAKALGYREAWTYTRPDEPGTSLRAAGFRRAGVTLGNGEHDRPARARRTAEQPGIKTRWVRDLAS